VIEQKFDGTSGVMNNSMQGATPITGNQLENMKNAIFPTPLLDYKANATKVEVLPQESIDGKPRLVLQVTPKSGSVVKLYLDPETFLVARTKATVNSPEMGDMEQIADSSDYRTVDGLKIPFQLVNWNAAQSIKITLTKVENNVPLDDALFAAKAPAVR
jgi:outer membrane lipoprotein-sorting protein